MDFFDNGCDPVESTTWDKQHLKPVVSLDCYRSNLLASASCDGEIVVWIRKRSDPKFHLKDLKGKNATFIVRIKISLFILRLLNTNETCYL